MRMEASKHPREFSKTFTASSQGSDSIMRFKNNESAVDVSSSTQLPAVLFYLNVRQLTIKYHSLISISS